MQSGASQGISNYDYKVKVQGLGMHSSVLHDRPSMARQGRSQCMQNYTFTYFLKALGLTV